MENKTLSMYVSDSAERVLPDGSTKKHLFCHRLGNHIKVEKDLRTTKSPETNKINKTCPSQIEVTTLERDGALTIKVKFWSTHCGHVHDIERIQLDKETKTNIAGKNENIKVEENKLKRIEQIGSLNWFVSLQVHLLHLFVQIFQCIFV